MKKTAARLAQGPQLFQAEDCKVSTLPRPSHRASCSRRMQMPPCIFAAQRYGQERLDSKERRPSDAFGCRCVRQKREVPKAEKGRSFGVSLALRELERGALEVAGRASFNILFGFSKEFLKISRKILKHFKHFEHLEHSFPRYPNTHSVYSASACDVAPAQGTGQRAMLAQAVTVT